MRRHEVETNPPEAVTIEPKIMTKHHEVVTKHRVVLKSIRWSAVNLALAGKVLQMFPMACHETIIG